MGSLCIWLRPTSSQNPLENSRRLKASRRTASILSARPPMPDRTNSGPSDYLAAERTLLASIRTGLALMGFGFVVARFGLFLDALLGNRTGLASQRHDLSFWFGTALILAGVLVE